MAAEISWLRRNREDAASQFVPSFRGRENYVKRGSRKLACFDACACRERGIVAGVVNFTDAQLRFDESLDGLAGAAAPADPFDGLAGAPAPAA
jgi:hypothetical protein